MNNTTLVEAYFDTRNHSNTLKNSAVECGFASLDTIASLLANQREALPPEQCEAVGQLLKEVSMMTFMAYERAAKH